jgi:hypothetical protein
MKELEDHIDPTLGQEETRQIRKEKPPLTTYSIPPGCKLWEMVAVSDDPDRPLAVLGMSEDGSYDPELALVRPARLEAYFTTDYQDPEITIAENVPIRTRLEAVAMVAASAALGAAISREAVIPADITGKIARGQRWKVIQVEGNFYEVASNSRNARRKIIAKHFAKI